MAYGDATGPGYPEGTPTARLAGRDLGRTAVSGIVPTVQEVTHEITAIGDNVRQVTTAGTRVRLAASSLLVRRVVIVALETNTSKVVVGGSTVVAAAGTQASPTMRGFPLNPGTDWIEFNFNDLTNIYVDARTSGDGVSYVYWT